MLQRLTMLYHPRSDNDRQEETTGQSRM